jgi:hypothetical protein
LHTLHALGTGRPRRTDSTSIAFSSGIAFGSFGTARAMNNLDDAAAS